MDDPLIEQLDGSVEMSAEYKAEVKEVSAAVLASCKAEGLGVMETQARCKDALGALATKHLGGPAAAPSLGSLSSGEYTKSWEVSASCAGAWRPPRPGKPGRCCTPAAR